jgi:hypothetical protein
MALRVVLVVLQGLGMMLISYVLQGCSGSEPDSQILEVMPTPAPTTMPTMREAFDIDVEKLKAAAKKMLVDGEGTAMANAPGSYFKSVDSIDRALSVRMTLPASDMAAEARTCGRAWKCEELDYETCPGMMLTTGMTRHWGGATPSPYMTSVNGTASGPYRKPLVTWTAAAGKFYTLLMIDFLNSNWQGGSAWWHWAVYNIEGTNVSTGFEPASGYTPPGTWFQDYNHYTYLLYEHDAPLQTVEEGEKYRLTALANFSFSFQDYVSALGLEDRHLVSVNWWKVKTSPGWSRLQLTEIGIADYVLYDSTGSANSDGWCKDQLVNFDANMSVLDMCAFEIDRDCKKFLAIPESRYR